MKAIKRAETAPIRSEPMKISKNRPAAAMNSSLTVLSLWPASMTVWYMTIPIASLKIDSPKMIALRFTSASISLKIAMTETGSVALIRLPKAKASLHENSGESGVNPVK